MVRHGGTGGIGPVGSGVDDVCSLVDITRTLVATTGEILPNQQPPATLTAVSTPRHPGHPRHRRLQLANYFRISSAGGVAVADDDRQWRQKL